MMPTAMNRFFGIAIALLCTPTFAGDCGHGSFGQSNYSYSAAPMTYTSPATYSNYAYTYPATYSNYAYTYPSSAYTYPANYSYNYGYSMPAQTMAWQPMVLAPGAAQSSGASTQSANCSGASAASSESKGSQALAQAIEQFLSSGKFSAKNDFSEIDLGPIDRRDEADDGNADINKRLDDLDTRLKKVEAHVFHRKGDSFGDGAADNGSRHNRGQLRKIRKRLDHLDSKVTGIKERTDLMYEYLKTQDGFPAQGTKPE